jgi:hypothetical protein
VPSELRRHRSDAAVGRAEPAVAGKLAVGSTATHARPLSTRCPATAGDKNWEPAAYNPELFLLYIPTSEECSEVRNIPRPILRIKAVR